MLYLLLNNIQVNKQLFRKAVFAKTAPKAVPQAVFAKTEPKAVPQAVPKAVPQTIEETKLSSSFEGE